MDETTAIPSFTTAGVEVPEANVLPAQPQPATNTLFAKLLADAKREVAKPDFIVPVDTRPGYILVFSGDLPENQLEAWQNRCRKGAPGTPQYNDLNQLQLSKITIANQCTGIKYGDPNSANEPELIRDSAGQPVTFQNKEFLIALGTADMPNEGVAAFIDHDAWVMAIGVAVMKGTGWNAEAKTDPLAG